jgi:hypothetical protein
MHNMPDDITMFTCVFDQDWQENGVNNWYQLACYSPQCRFYGEFADVGAGFTGMNSMVQDTFRYRQFNSIAPFVSFGVADDQPGHRRARGSWLFLAAELALWMRGELAGAPAGFVFTTLRESASYSQLLTMATVRFGVQYPVNTFRTALSQEDSPADYHVDVMTRAKILYEVLTPELAAMKARFLQNQQTPPLATPVPAGITTDE